MGGLFGQQQVAEASRLQMGQGDGGEMERSPSSFLPNQSGRLSAPTAGNDN